MYIVHPYKHTHAYISMTPYQQISSKPRFARIVDSRCRFR